MEWLQSWLFGLTGAAVFCAVATELTPRGPVKGVVKTVCGAVLAAALLTPLFSFDFPAYALNLARYRETAEAVTAQAEEISGELNRRVIAERLRAYILDKAQSLGTEVTDARITLEWSVGNGVWLPVSVELEGAYNASLAACIEGELGIPEGAQTWRNDADG